MKKCINVLHMAGLTQGYGVERQLLAHLELSKVNSNGISHFVLATKISGELAKELQELDIPYMVNRMHNPLQMLDFIKFAKKNDIHIIHIHNLLRNPIRTRIISYLAGIPAIIEHERGMVWNMRFPMLVKMTNKMVDLNICNSNASKILLKHKCDIEAKVIHNGIKRPAEEDVDCQKLKAELGIAESADVVGFVGRLNTPKGVHAFIRMIPKVKEKCPNTEFLIVGDGPMRLELDDYAKKCNVRDDIKFLGYRKDARTLMKIMDILVVPSIREPFGNVVIEGAFAKKPVIASNVDGIRETIVDTVTGYLIDCTEEVPTRKNRKASRLPEMVVDGKSLEIRPPRLPDSRELADKVVYCLKNPDVRKLIGEESYKNAIEKFSMERYKRDIDNIYHNLIKVAD